MTTAQQPPSTPPKGFAPYKRTRTFDEGDIPAALLNEHKTKAGVWARIHVESGVLRYRQAAPPVDVAIAAGETLAAAPELPHQVAPEGLVTFYVEFWRADAP